LCAAVEVSFDAVDQQNVDIMLLIKQQHRPQVTDALVSKFWTENQITLAYD